MNNSPGRVLFSTPAACASEMTNRNKRPKEVMFFMAVRLMVPLIISQRQKLKSCKLKPSIQLHLIQHLERRLHDRCATL